jgi:hypothetical protein
LWNTLSATSKHLTQEWSIFAHTCTAFAGLVAGLPAAIKDYLPWNQSLAKALALTAIRTLEFEHENSHFVIVMQDMQRDVVKSYRQIQEAI